MNRMILGLVIAASLGATPPAAAQDVYESAVADHGQVVRDNAILRHNLQYARNRQKGLRGTTDSDRRKAEACSNRARFAREYGADNPKVRQLNGLCAKAGY